MKESSIILYNVVLTLSVLLFLPLAPLNGQTNFVKYAGNPVLSGNTDSGAWDSFATGFASNVLFDRSTYHIWYTGRNSSSFSQHNIGLATSTDGINWNRHVDNPVISEIFSPYVLFDGSLYEIWYSGDRFTTINYATATDPAVWTEHPDNPVLTTDTNPNVWDQREVVEPVVIRSDTLYQMWFAGQAAGGSQIWQTGYATSADGVNWNKHADNPVLPVGAPGEWDDYGASAGSVLFEAGQYQMWYDGARTNTPFSIGYATSQDGITWTKHPGNPILEGKPTFWDLHLGFPRVLKHGNRYRMWYSGWRGAVDAIGYAEDFSNAAHTDSILATVDGDTVHIVAYIANPHIENLGAHAQIKNEDGSVSVSVDLTDTGNGIWQGAGAVTEEVNYSVGVELQNVSAGYSHNSFDWGVFDEFDIATGIDDNRRNNIPSEINLRQNYPNPFNPTTKIDYELPVAGHVELKIYNTLGQEVRTLANAIQPAGTHQVVWDGKDGRGTAMPNSLYFYRLKTGSLVQTRKMLLIK